MRVAELTAYHVRIPLRKSFRHASHTRTSTDNIVIRCVLEDGTQGYGEGVPREYVTGETIESSLDLLQRADWAAQLSPCDDFAAAVALAERLELPEIAGDDRGCMGNGARCAVELALLDAFGKHFKQPLSEVARQLAPDLFEPRHEVRYSGAITTGHGLKLRISAWKMWAYRFRQVKVKVGIAGHDDVRRLRVIRRRVGQHMDLRIDANEAWSAEEAAARIQALEPFGITAAEQPIPHEQVARLKEVRKQTKTPIMLDESLCGRIDAERAIEGQTCDLFNIRLSKCGGFIPSLRLAQLANQHGLDYQLGCQVGETCLLSAAGRHFAASVRDIRYVEGSYDRHLVREALGTRDITFGRGGKAPALTSAGLGVDIDPEALRRVTIRELALFSPQNQPRAPATGVTGPAAQSGR